MDTTFAPSYNNLTIDWWEVFCIKRNNPFAAYIIFYGRYIDNDINIWDGPSADIDSFVQYCHGDNMGLSFTHVWNSTS